MFPGSGTPGGAGDCGGLATTQSLDRTHPFGQQTVSPHGQPSCHANQYHGLPVGAATQTVLQTGSKGNAGCDAVGITPTGFAMGASPPHLPHVSPAYEHRLGAGEGAPPMAEVAHSTRSSSTALQHLPGRICTLDAMASRRVACAEAERQASTASAANVAPDNVTAPVPAGGSSYVRGELSSLDSTSEAAETSRQSQELLHEMKRLRLQMSELERVAGASHVRRGARPRGQQDRLSVSASSVSGDSRCLGEGAAGCDGSGAEQTTRGTPPSLEYDTQGAPQMCPSCGNIFLPDADFCRKCGAKRPTGLGRLAVATAATTCAASSVPSVMYEGSPQPPCTPSAGERDVLLRGALTSSQVRSARSVRSEQPVPQFTGWEYKAHSSGDPVDIAVAALVNRPGRYHGWRALLCRLDQGVYLCGTRRVNLRVDTAGERIEASNNDGETWEDLEFLLGGAEASQRNLLDSTRNAASLTK